MINDILDNWPEYLFWFFVVYGALLLLTVAFRKKQDTTIHAADIAGELYANQISAAEIDVRAITATEGTLGAITPAEWKQGWMTVGPDQNGCWGASPLEYVEEWNQPMSGSSLSAESVYAPSGSSIAGSGQYIDPYTGMVSHHTPIKTFDKPKEPAEPDKRKCFHCGSRYSNELDRCPYCGGGAR